MQVRPAVLFGLLLFGCGGPPEQKPEAPPAASQPSAAASAPAAAPSAEVPPACRAVCTRVAACGIVEPACETTCGYRHQVGRMNTFCNSANEARDQCLAGLACPEVEAFGRAAVAGLTEGIPCQDESERMYLYCSGTPETHGCGAVCTAQSRCAQGDGSGLEACMLGCLRDGWARRRELGAECWNAGVILNLCRSTKANACSVFRAAMSEPENSAAHPCQTELEASRRACR